MSDTAVSSAKELDRATTAPPTPPSSLEEGLVPEGKAERGAKRPSSFEMASPTKDDRIDACPDPKAVLDAVESGDLDKLASFGKDALLAARDEEGFTCLHIACMRGDVEMAQCLLRQGCDVGAKNDRGSTPLHWACSRGHTKIVKLLVGVYGGDFATPAGNGSTPLHWAASKDQRAVMKILLGIYCAQVDVKDDKGCTPCLMAALNGHLKSVKLLIDRFHSKVTAHDRKRTNLLHAACEMGHADLASALIDDYSMAVEEQDRKGLTPLARAAQRNQVEVFRRLVDKHGARLDALTTRKSGLLHVTCEAGSLDMAKLLLDEYRFEVDARNADGDTPALMAASRGHAEVLALLVDDHAARLDTSDSKGAGPLHKACERRQSGAASVLLESYGLPADTTDPTGATPLHLAARGGDAALVELLTGPKGRADPGLRDGEGNLALHIAAACGHLGVVKVMAEKTGADLGARDRSDKSALDVAVGKANTEIADYLREVLPDKGEHHDHCERRGGFKRAGRWIRLGRDAGHLQDLALDNVHLLPVATLLEHGRFPSHYDASRKKYLVTASDVPPQAQVLLVSHPWESPGNPDPSGKQFLALRRFLEEARAGAGGTKGNDDNNDGGAMGRGFGYVWASFSCTSSNRMKPMFATHVHNILTAWCFADHALVIPETVTRVSDGFSYSDMRGFVERGWCSVELLCAMHLGIPTTVHVALGDAISEGVSRGRLMSDGGTELPPSAVFARVATPEMDSPLQGAGAAMELSGEGTEDCSLSAGACVTRAVESASKRLCACPARTSFTSSTSPVVHASFSPCATAALTEEETLMSATVSDGGEGAVAAEGDNDGDGESRGGIGEDGAVPETSDESEHVANVLWSSEAAAFLNSVARLVADVLASLDREVALDKEALTKTTAQEAGAGAIRADVVDDDLMGGDGEGEGQADVVPEDSKAGQLLCRILGFGLSKQDVEEDVGAAGGSGSDGQDEGKATADPLMRELYMKLGVFSSAHEKLDAMNGLLLAGSYCKVLRSTSEIISRVPSPRRSYQPRRRGRDSPSPSRSSKSPSPRPSLRGEASPRPSLGGGASPRPSLGSGVSPRPSLGSGASPRPSFGGAGSPRPSWGGASPRPSLGGGGGLTRASPAVADSVPSCHVS